MCIHTRLDEIRLTGDATKFNINTGRDTIFAYYDIAANNEN